MTPSPPTNDNDGVTETEEQAAPNSGDANNDGLSDADQNNVTSFVNSLTNSYSVLENTNNCQNTEVSQRKMSDLSKSDGSYAYPAGLMNFTLVCGIPGMTVRVNQYYFGITATNLVARKYNSRTNTYSTISGAEITYVTIDGQQAVKISYDITDGGLLDDDGIANGSIVDPAGPAVLSNSAGAPNTGFETQSPWLSITYGAIGIGFSSVAVHIVRRRNYKKTL